MRYFERVQQAWKLAIVFFTLIAVSPAFAVSEQEAAAIARHQVDGRVLNVKESQVDGRRVYLVKLITSDSRVIIMQVDADSGQVLPSADPAP